MIPPPKYLTIQEYFDARDPKKEAEAPKRINIKEKPATKKRVERKTFLRVSFLSSVSSSRERPVIKEKYAGIKGKTQGEKKDSNPAIRAAG